MKKGKEWFIKELLGHEIGDYGNYYNSGYEDALSYALVLAHQLDEPEKVVVPQFVAEYLEFAKNDASLVEAMKLINENGSWPPMKKEYDWFVENEEKFMRAWLNGYTVAE